MDPTNYAGAKGYIGAQVGGLMPEGGSALTRAENKAEELQQLAIRVSVLADRICGPVPREASSAGGFPPASGGLFGSLNATVDGMARSIAAAHDDLNRIERALP